MSQTKRSRMGPESDEYNRLKGRIIRITPHGHEAGALVGRLIWVDIYTLGVALDPSNPTNVSIVYKAGILHVASVIAEAKRDNYGVTAP